MKSTIMINCKVKGGFSSNFKQKVFVSFHSGDRKHLESIIMDIWKNSDCAIYYHEGNFNEEDADLDDLGMKLLEMKLFVIIITESYLTENSLARNWEYGFALKNHIPVLPIAVQSGLEELFTGQMNDIGEGYGDIQLLNAQAGDGSEISYEQKLGKRLNAILINDEELGKIHQAFSGQIFLSYRKKDRKYANELMRTIHSIHSLRNVSVWYDEFIATGEKWSDQISDALKTSDIFLLMVTPSLTEPDNYVIREEYPEARRQNKTVVPVGKSDEIRAGQKLEELKTLFPGLDTWIDGENTEELEKALFAIANMEENDPEKDYLIGLAFFGGIEVEKDSERAVSLIVASAESGLPAAVKKLAQMYWEGDGLARNLENSILWHRKLVGIYETKIKDTADTAELKDYFDEMETLVECLYELGSFREALEYGSRYALMSEKHDFEGIVKYRAHAYDLCGKICRRLSLYDEAFTFTAKYHALRKRVYESEQTLLNLHNLAVACERLGQVYYAMGDMNQAEHWYLESMEMDRILDKQMQTYDSAYSLYSIYMLLSNLYIRKNIYDKAAKWNEQALELIEKIQDAKDTDANRKEYASTLTASGTVYLLKGNIKTAGKLFGKAKDIALELVDRNPSAEYQHFYTVILNRLADVYRIRQDYELAITLYEDSMSRRRKILEKFRTPESVFEYALTVFYKAEVHADVGHQKEAVKHYEEAADQLSMILPRDVSGNWHTVYAHTCFKRFVLDTFTGKKYLQSAIDAWKWLADKNPDEEEYKKQYEKCLKMYKRCYPQ